MRARTEQIYSGGWVDDFRVTYKYDAMERQDYEEREDCDMQMMPPVWTTQYDTTQEYDKNGNRTRLHRNTLSGQEGNYGTDVDLSYTFDVLNSPTSIEDADDEIYLCTVTCDANGNITELKEAILDGQMRELAVFWGKGSRAGCPCYPPGPTGSPSAASSFYRT